MVVTSETELQVSHRFIPTLICCAGRQRWKPHHDCRNHLCRSRWLQCARLWAVVFIAQPLWFTALGTSCVHLSCSA